MTEPVIFLDGRVSLWAGDCIEVLAGFEANSFDSVVTDPPYFLTADKKGGSGEASDNSNSPAGRSRIGTGFMGRKWDAPDLPPIDPGFAHWMAGFIDGEGCFHVHKKTVNGCQTFDCQFSMTLRADDADIVTEMQRQLGGIGSIARREPKQENAGPQVRYCISSKADCQRLREVLLLFPLTAKKLRDFEVWSLALDEWLVHAPGGSWEGMRYFRDYLMAMRRYGSHFSPAQLFHYRWARECLRVLKPGGHMLAFGGTRTSHRMTCAIEDAGFEIRDVVMWLYGSGFPKSHDVSKAIDKAAGAEREVIGPRVRVDGKKPGHSGIGANGIYGKSEDLSGLTETRPASPEAAAWAGWGTSLKPAYEPVILARRPLEGTVAANVLKWGTGAINIDGCRVGFVNDEDAAETKTKNRHGDFDSGERTSKNGIYGRDARTGAQIGNYNPPGRWPANIILDDSEEAQAAFPSQAGQTGGRVRNQAPRPLQSSKGAEPARVGTMGHGDFGSAARFFYSAKADSDDRLGSSHPTIKPVDLLRWLVRLVTPPSGTVLDCFAGTGTTAEACFYEGFRCTLIEREPEYQADIKRRMELCLAGPAERKRASAKAKNKQADDGPLFGGSA